MTVARLIRPQGRRGEVLAEILTDFPERFRDTRNAFLMREKKLPPEPVILEQSWLHKGKVVLKFAQVDSISAAEMLRGAEVVVPAAERVALEPDAFYISDLLGCEVVDVHPPDHRSIGTVRDVLQQPETVDMLAVETPDGREYSIPFAKAYLVQIDVAGRRLEMDLPPGLLDVNVPPSEEERRTRQAESEPES
ncbi:MAG: ribosome maturation factor RimM [Acidobacteriaceae bacterium]